MQDWETVQVKCTIIELDMPGVVTSYNDQQFVPMPELPEKGYMQDIKRNYTIPRMRLKFKAQVDQPLHINGVYSDGINTFKALEEYVIINERAEVDSFRIPTELKLVNFAVLKHLNTKP